MPWEASWDFAVIGAGPAGCAAAIGLARAGAQVGLLEKAAFPRDKLCGEFLSPEAARVLEELGCGEGFRAAQPARIERAVVVTASGTRIEFPLPRPAWGLSRLRFDQLLAEAAAAAGARLVEKAEIARTGHTLEARDGRRFRAGTVLLAAGRHSLPHPLAPGKRGRQYFGLKAHYEGECDGRVELYFFRGGYCGIAPVEGGRVNVCCLAERPLLAGQSGDALLAGVPSLRDRLFGLRRIEPFLHTGPVALGWRAPPAGVVAAGDAALFVDPFTGDGMSVALQSGRMAALHALGELPDYPRALRRRFSRQLRAGRLLRAAASAAWLERPLRGVLRSDRLRHALFEAAFRATRDLRGVDADDAAGDATATAALAAGPPSGPQ